MSDELKEPITAEENAGALEKQKKTKSRSSKSTSSDAVKKERGSDKTKRRKERKAEDGEEGGKSKSGSRRRKNSSASEADKPKRPKSKGSRSKLVDTSSPPNQPPSEPPAQPPAEPPSEPPAQPPTAQTDEEKFLELMEKKKAGGGGMANMNLTPIRRVEEDEPKGGKKRSFFGFGKRKQKEAVVGGVIEGSVKHEGHAGFQSGGGLSTSGLPPQLAEFFEKLNDLFHKLGYDGVTQQEVTFVLQEYGDVLLPDNQPPKPAVKVVEETAPEDWSKEELLVQFNTQAAVLSGLKATHTTIQTAKEKLRAEVDQLNEQLEAERKALAELREKNTSLEVEVARLRAGGSVAEGDASDAFSQLEARMKEKLDEANARLKEEQDRTKELQAALNEYADEKTELVARLGESQEVMRQQLTASKRSVGDEPAAKMVTSTPAPAPPPPPPPPGAPPLNFPPDHAPPPPSGGGGLDLSAVTLKKAPPPTATKSSTADLLAQIRQGNPGLKKVEDAPKKDLPTDDSNVLNIIFNALVERRNAVTGNDEEESDDWDDSDCE